VTRFALFGHPVAHSLSPAIHAAAYRWLGQEHDYVLIDCPSESSFRSAVERVRSGELGGANVTVPHKQLALALADHVDESAAETGAANVLFRSASRLEAHNTDVPALIAELRALAPVRASCLILGAGGAALAAAVACRALGVDRIRIAARRFVADLRREEWPNAALFERMGAELVGWPVRDRTLAPGAVDVGLLIQATSAGLTGGEAEWEAVARIVPWEHVPASARAYDVVYTPAVTPFLARAQAWGLRSEGGLGMLVGQAARAIGLWLGATPELEPLRRAAERELERRGQA